MKTHVLRADLLSLIGKVQGMIPAKPVVPILSNVLVRAIQGKVTISATDLNSSMRGQIPAQVEEEGAITLPARSFFQLVRELSTPDVTLLSSDQPIVQIHSGGSFFKLHGMDLATFPPFPDLQGAPSFSLPSQKLKEMLSRSVFAASRDSNRRVLCGISMSIEQNKATFLAADGKKLAKLFTSIPTGETVGGSYILPIKAVDEMIKLLDKEETTHLYLYPDKIALEAGETTFVTKLLSGEYPSFDMIIPEKGERTFTLHREELISLLRQISLFVDEDHQSVQLHFQKGELVVTASQPKLGEGRVTMPLDYAGEPIDFSLNPLFLHEILRHSKDETISFSMTSTYSPSMVTDSSSAQFIIMPMRFPSPS